MLYKKSQILALALSVGLGSFSAYRNPAKLVKRSQHSPMIYGSAIILTSAMATLSSAVKEQHPTSDLKFDQDAVNASIILTGVNLLVGGLVNKHALEGRTEISSRRAVAVALARTTPALAGPLVLKGLKAIRNAKLPAPQKSNSKKSIFENA